MKQACFEAPEPAVANPPGSRLTMGDFHRLREFIHGCAGINLADAKLTMAEARLRKRLDELGMTSYHAYCDLVLGPRGEAELPHLLDRITTNKTDFFREAKHFDYLTAQAIPALAARHGSGVRAPFDVWSAGCSSGEEPYTLAMVLNERAAASGGRFRYSILATDISTRVLEKARAAVYTTEVIAPVPLELRRKYLLRSKDPDKQVVRVCPELRAMVEFRRLNFNDSDFGLSKGFDAIFCRNVMIYFDARTQARLVNRFATHLKPGGYLFIGHSETLNGLNAPFVPLAPSVYRRAD
jgi:chemotaxis protein methyltransferase CheR